MRLVFELLHALQEAVEEIEEYDLVAPLSLHGNVRLRHDLLRDFRFVEDLQDYEVTRPLEVVHVVVLLCHAVQYRLAERVGAVSLPLVAHEVVTSCLTY